MAGNQAPPDQPYRNLIAALIHDATFEFREDRRVATKNYRMGKSYPHKAEEFGLEAAKRGYAWRWIAGTGRGPYSFEWCCIVIDCEPERVRAGILEKSKLLGRKNAQGVWR